MSIWPAKVSQRAQAIVDVGHDKPLRGKPGAVVPGHGTTARHPAPPMEEKNDG